jgi:hypothetical protein
LRPGVRTLDSLSPAPVLAERLAGFEAKGEVTRAPVGAEGKPGALAGRRETSGTVRAERYQGSSHCRPIPNVKPEVEARDTVRYPADRDQIDA